MAERTETLAAIRSRLLAAGPTRATRTRRKPKQTREEKTSALWKRAWAKINAETATGDIATASATVAKAPEAKPTTDRVRAAQRRGMRQSNE